MRGDSEGEPQSCYLVMVSSLPERLAKTESAAGGGGKKGNGDGGCVSNLQIIIRSEHEY